MDLYILLIYTFVWLQVKPAMVYAQVDKSKKRVSQQEHKPTADLECDDVVTESKASEVSALK